jgi:hypothetical protein
MPIQYYDFDLLIERTGDGFKARVLDSPAGEATAQFQLPFTQADVENFYTQIGHSRLVESSQMQKMRLFGQDLFEATFTGNVRDKFKQSLAEVNRAQAGLRIRLRLVDVPELVNMPWEFMYDASLSRFLTLSVETPLVRYLDVPREIQPLTVRPPLKILAVISSPRNFPSLNVQREWGNLQEALSRLENRDLVRLTQLEKPTLQALQRQLRRGEYHIFHFIGHGIFSKHHQDGQLLFENELKGGDPVSSRDLGILLHDHRQLRLAVLNACEGARTSMEDQFSGTAQSLIQQGLPAVIAMQFRITDIAAITLAREFYAALADGYPVDASLTEARKSIKTHGNELEWGTPVLYMRSPNGQIFDVESIQRATTPIAQPDPQPDTEADRQLTLLYTEGLEAFYLKEWDKAVTKFKTILATQSDYKDAAAKLDQAQRELNLSSLDQKAQLAESEGDWVAAIKALEALSKELPEQTSLSSRLEHARQLHRLNNLYAEARQLSKAKKWMAVIQVFREIHSLDANYPDKDGLLSAAEGASAAQKLQEELESMYQNALQAIDAGKWQKARDILQSFQSRLDKYRQTEKLLERVNNEIARIEKRTQEQEQVASLYLQAENLANRKQWTKVLEKIEEIHTLQSDFDDPEQLAVQARSELKKAKDETERQDQLAALYSEAVQLNQADEYQQALDKWNQIRALDATYPDKQRVQATAQRMLRKATQPENILGKLTWRPKLTPAWGLLFVGALWFLARFGALSMTSVYDIYNIELRELIRWTLFGIATGLLNLLIYHFFKVVLSNKQRLILAGGWFVGSLAVPMAVWLLPNSILRFHIGYAISGAAYGLVLHYTLPEFLHRPKLSTLIFSFSFGMFAGDCSYTWFRDSAGFEVLYYGALPVGVAAIISGSLAFGKAINAHAEYKAKLTIGKMALAIAGIWIAARWLGNVIGETIANTILLPLKINWGSSPFIMANLYYVLFAIFSAWFILRYLKFKLEIPITGRDAAFMASFWIIGMVTASFLSVYLATDLENEWGWRIGWGVGGLVIGLGMWLATRKFSVRPKPAYLLTSILGWEGGFFLSELIVGLLQNLVTQIFNESLGWNILINFNVGLAGLIGGLVLYTHLIDDNLFTRKSDSITEAQKAEIPDSLRAPRQWLKFFIVFALSRVIVDIIVFTTGLYSILENSIGVIAALNIYFTLFGFSTGSAIWLTLRRKHISSSWKTWLFLSLVSSISIAVFFTGALLAELGNWPWTAAWGLIGICVGLALANHVRTKTPTLPKALYWQLPLVWTISFVIGQLFAREIDVLLYGMDGTVEDILVRAIETGVYGLVGSLVTIKLIEFEKKQFIRMSGILLALLIIFSFATGLQAFQKSFVDEPFAGAIGNWNYFRDTISIRRSLITGQYTVTLIDRNDGRCNNTASTAIYKATYLALSLTSTPRFQCNESSSSYARFIQLIYNPGYDSLTSSYGTSPWTRK